MIAKDITEWTDLETMQYEWHEKYKRSEYQIYKDFHRIVLNDDGTPHLKKSAFKMPGYRKVLGKKLVEYEIDYTSSM